MRLIDADALKQEMLEAGAERNKLVKANALCSIINYQPTITPPPHRVPADQPPEVNEDGESEYILLFFSNFPLPIIGLYRKDDAGGGAYYYADDEDETLCSYGLFVNAWMPLPEPYKEDK